MSPISADSSADNGRPLSAGTWQTSVGRLAAAAIVTVIARWATGPTFGYTLFTLIWAPIGLLFLCPPTGRHRKWAFIGVALTAAVPIVQIEPIASAGRQSAVIASCMLAIAALRNLHYALLTLRMKPQHSGANHARMAICITNCVATFLWLAWAIGPLLRSDAAIERWGEERSARLLAVHPVLALNAAATTAADATHQAIAYGWLTRLGQDVPFDWPSSVWPCVGLHVGIAFIFVVFQAIIVWVARVNSVNRGEVEKA